MVNTGNMPTSLKRRSGQQQQAGGFGGFGGAGFGGSGAGFGTDGGGTYWYSSDGQEFSGSNAGGFSDFFEQMFGHRTRGGGGANAGFRGQDYHADLNLSLREAAKTHKQILTVNGKQVRITIPAGVANGQVIKLKGYGGEGINGGPAGDLYITFVIPDDSVFKRLGDDLYVDVTVDLYTALAGWRTSWWITLGWSGEAEGETRNSERD